MKAATDQSTDRKIHHREAAACQLSDHIPSVLQRIFSARGATADSDIDYRSKNLLPPSSLMGVDAAVALLKAAITQQQKVIVVGDFDADGATSCALSLLALRAMGLQHIDFLVPNRFEYGYGLTPEIVDVAQQQQPDLIITVDNGIASVDGVAKAKSVGIKVLVTDHHLPPTILPDADAIVNPNQQGCAFASKNLAGVGVIFYVLSALRASLRDDQWFVQQNISEPVMAEYLDLVALGTVADVVPLDYNNRVLVYQGLQRLRQGYTRPGIVALLQIAGKDYRRAKTSDFGFIIGPRLNAAGRLDDMSVGIRCLLAEDEDIARELAVELDGLNRDRRAIEASMQVEALRSLEQIQLEQPLGDDTAPAAICLYDDSWHQGVVGILASRIKEKFYRPVIAFAPSGTNDDEIKGSARSIPNLHIRDTLDAIATQYPDVLQKFGGHAMAAGLSLRTQDYKRFNTLFIAQVEKQLSAEDLQEVVFTDGVLSADELTLEMAYTLEQAGPWGQQFAEPLFDGCFYIVQQRLVGDKHLKLVLATDANKQQLVDAIAFNVDIKQWPNNSVEQVQLVYQMDINHFRGKESLQLLVKELQQVVPSL